MPRPQPHFSKSTTQPDDLPISATSPVVISNPMAGEPELSVAEEQLDVELPEKWPGWPGLLVFRVVVPVERVDRIIGRQGELLVKLMDETRARVRLLEWRPYPLDRIVLISAKEEPEAALSPAMNAVIRIFKQVNGLIRKDGEDKSHDANSTAFCTVRLLLPFSQGLTIIGKQGRLIKSIRESSGASAEVHHFIDSDESILELHGEAHNVHIALDAVLLRLRKFLVDKSVLPLFEQNYNVRPAEETQVGPPPGGHKEPQVFRHTMQLPIRYAVALIGAKGTNIDYIRCTSGAIVSVEEIEGVIPEEIKVVIKGSSSQVQLAQELIEEYIAGHTDSLQERYENQESGYLPSPLGRSLYSPSPLKEHYVGGHESSGEGNSGL